MFTGIVADSVPVLKARMRDQVIEIVLSRPSVFQDIQSGDSIAVDGVCLTVEKIESQKMIFALAKDTLRTTDWTLEELNGKIMNVEPSLKLNDRLNGHFVTGHVDGMAQVDQVKKQGENQFLIIKFPLDFKSFFWKKGYVTINGVSLTIQDVMADSQLRLGLVPETLKRTNLSQLKKGSQVTFEVCYLARMGFNFFKNYK